MKYAAFVILLILGEVLLRLYLSRRRAVAKHAVYCPFCHKARTLLGPTAGMWPRKGVSVPEVPCEPCRQELRGKVINAARAPIWADGPAPPKSGRYLNGAAHGRE